ncbi:hypothetical protein DT246_13070, partial [Staphylococcus haemolyticus]
MLSSVQFIIEPFNPDLAPGTEEVVQNGENGEKTITTPTTKNPLTGEKV